MKKGLIASLVFLALSFAFAARGIAAVGNNNPAIAYDSLSNRYLVVYAKTADGVVYNVYGRLIKSDGTAFAAEFAISTESGGETLPAVAFDSFNRRFLVVWSDTRNSATTGSDIYGKILYSDGTAYSSADFFVSRGTAASHDQTSPAVAFDAFNARYAVAWTDSRNLATTGTDIYARLVTAAGALYGTADIAVATGSAASDDQSEPAIAYDPGNRKLLIAWQDGRNTATTMSDVYGRVMSEDGTFGAADFAISNAADDQLNPSIAYDSANGRFLVAWTDYRDRATLGAEIYASVVNSSGVEAVTDFRISDAADTSGQLSPSALYNSFTGRYVVAWHDGRNSATTLDVYAQSVNVSGSLNGANFSVDSSSASQSNPVMAYNNTCGNAVIAYEDASATPQAVALALEGSPCQDLTVGCFIATAAYGTPLHADVEALRRFRDQYLLTNLPGRTFVKIYYTLSPPAARFISRHESLRAASRTALTPVVYSIKHPAHAALAFIGLIAAAVVLYGKKR